MSIPEKNGELGKVVWDTFMVRTPEYFPRPYELPEFVRKRAIEKGLIAPKITWQERGMRATGYHWLESPARLGADFWLYEETK